MGFLRKFQQYRRLPQVLSLAMVYWGEGGAVLEGGGGGFTPPLIQENLIQYFSAN